VFVNLSNHPSTQWTDAQRGAALALAGEIGDLPFPEVPPDAPDVGYLVAPLLADIPAEATHTMVMGEHTLTVALVRALQARGIVCVAATSRRDVRVDSSGLKTVRFEFVAFREYPRIADSVPRRVGG
jgi:hypothetical protein